MIAMDTGVRWPHTGRYAAAGVIIDSFVAHNLRGE